jgi:excisionase family DNA binding protein
MTTAVDSTYQGASGTSLNSLLTFKEAQDYLRVSRSTLYRLMWSGQLTSHKVGSQWRFYFADVQACVRAPSHSCNEDGVADISQK